MVPRLWSESVETHRRAVREATLDAAAALVRERGLRAVTMSQIAQESGIGRATLYKYFPDLEAILRAWHEREVTRHLAELAELRDRTDESERLEVVLEAYARIRYEHDGGEAAALLHQAEHVARAQDHLRDFLRGLLIEGAQSGDVRDDVPADELASYCLHALAAAGRLPSKAAVRRLVMVTLTALRRPESHSGRLARRVSTRGKRN